MVRCIAILSILTLSLLTLGRPASSQDLTPEERRNRSSFVWDREGHVVTNFHVIQQGDAFSVTLAGQSEWEARVIAPPPRKTSRF